jgi:GNAT superfamily N-acetyltransferase
MNLEPGAMPVVIRPGRREDFSLLQELERDAAVLFSQRPELAVVPDDITPDHDLERALAGRTIWVAEVGGEIAGYAYALPLDRNLHLEEISVAQRFGRRGIGRTLVGEVLDRARSEGLPAVTLTTFRDVPWNAPFYQRLGFRVLEPLEMTPGLREAVEDEGRRGLPVELRVAMIYRFDERP